jgi:glycosyltransferase involved in cell wall biosynthesis
MSPAVGILGARTSPRPEEALPAPALAEARARGHLCFVAPYAWPVLSGDARIEVLGGAEVQQAILARLFAAHGYRVTMICQDFGQPDGAQIDGVVVRKVFAGRQGVPVLRFVYPRLTTMWRMLKEVDADIYYYRSASMWLGILEHFCRRHGKRLVYAGAANPDFAPDVGGQIRFARDRWLYRRGLAGAHAVVAQNPAQVAALRTHYGREALQIPSCYVPPPASGKASPQVVLWVSMLRPQKRPELFLELARRFPAWRFALVGGADLGDRGFFSRVERAARALPNLTFTGFLPLAEAEQWFDRARVLVNTSAFEGMPNTFLQAWARGVPTLSFVDVGARVNRSVKDIDEMAAALGRLLGDGAAWREASQRCREHFARTHSREEVMARYDALFDQLMREQPGR